MKVLVDVPVEPSFLAALQASGRHAITTLNPPGESARALDPALIREAEVLF